MGKPITQARAETKGAVGFMKWFAERAPGALKAQEIDTSNGVRLRLGYEPLGSLLVIQPWNFPFFLPLKNSIPSLLAGNTVLLKPAPCVPQTSLLLQSIMEEAGLANGEY